MTTALYADAELLTVGLLAAHFPSARVTTETPNDLASILPVIWVKRSGGLLSLGLDTAQMDIDCFAADELTVNAFAMQVATVMQRAAGYMALAASISAVTVRDLSWRPYIDTNVRSFGMTCDITIHNHQ
jgi:hypothetical protein